jgi:hypothetical protein
LSERQRRAGRTAAGGTGRAGGRLGGTLDGAVEWGLAFTVPVAAGFPAVEAVFNAWVTEHPGRE